METHIKTLYRQRVVPALIKRFLYKNLEEVPKLLKITINRRLNQNFSKNNTLAYNQEEIANIVGQKPRLNKSKKAISGFKLRAGVGVGLSVTLRNTKMYTFFTKLVHIILPQVRDFQGLDSKSFDGQGNYNFGIIDQLVFPEIEYDTIIKLNGVDVSITTTSKTDEESYELLKLMGLPLQDIK